MTDKELLDNLIERLKLARLRALSECDFKMIEVFGGIISYIERNRTKCD